MSQKYYQNLFNLNGKNAIVTGGAGLLGSFFCKGLADFGANVAVVDIDRKRASSLADSIQKEYSVNSLGIECDITDPKSVTDMVDMVANRLGDIHILHNNAAGKSDNLDAFFAPFEAYTLEEWRKIMAVNIDGMFLVAQAVGKHMIQHGDGGSIIQTSSIYGVTGPDQRIYEGSFFLNRQINTPAVYSATKASVIGLTKYLATYWADKGIRVNTITPGGVESGQNETFQKKYSAKVPLRRMARPDEMVGILIYLASDAASYVTGQNFIIDGGFTIQ